MQKTDIGLLLKKAGGRNKSMLRKELMLNFL